MKEEFARLYETVTGSTADDALNTAVESMIQLSGRGPDRFPAYLSILADSLARRQILAPAPIQKEDRGYAWLLRELLPLLPGCDFNDDEPKRELFICEPLERAAVVDRGKETYAVVPWPDATADDAKERIIGSFDPTEEEIRRWAYDPDLLMYVQDEEAILSRRANIPLFIELASDPKCPKRGLIIAIADDYVSNARGGSYDRELLEETIRLAGAETREDINSWSRDLQFLLAYLNGHGPIEIDTARTVCRLIMEGRFRPAVEIREETLGRWWQFSTWNPHTNGATDFLYICRDSGALIWSREPVTESDIEPYASPRQRDQHLGNRLA